MTFEEDIKLLKTLLHGIQTTINSDGTYNPFNLGMERLEEVTHDTLNFMLERLKGYESGEQRVDEVPGKPQGIGEGSTDLPRVSEPSKPAQSPKLTEDEMRELAKGLTKSFNDLDVPGEIEVKRYEIKKDATTQCECYDGYRCCDCKGEEAEKE